MSNDLMQSETAQDVFRTSDFFHSLILLSFLKAPLNYESDGNKIFFVFPSEAKTILQNHKLGEIVLGTLDLEKNFYRLKEVMKLYGYKNQHR